MKFPYLLKYQYQIMEHDSHTERGWLLFGFVIYLVSPLTS